MKHLILSTLLATVAITNTAYAIDKVYINFGGGYVLTNHDSSTTTTSNTIVTDPAGGIPGLFNLQNVNWRNTFFNGYEITLALGANFCPCWRGEGEFLYQNLRRHISGHYDWHQVSTEGGDVFTTERGIIGGTEKTLNVYALMANVYYDFKKICGWKPYIGVGIGPARIKSTSSTSNDELFLNDVTAGLSAFVPTTELSPTIYSTVFAWQLKAGMAYEFDDHFSILGQYRLFGTTGYDTSSSTIIVGNNVVSPPTFRVPGGNPHGLLNSGFDLTFKYVY